MDQLTLYNKALRICGETRLAGLADQRESRRHLDQVWNGDGDESDGITSVLEQGLWNFAMRQKRLDAIDSTREWGYRKMYRRPADMVRVAAVCTDEHMKSPLLHYQMEGEYIYTDLAPYLYLMYVSDDTDRGRDLSLWPTSFGEFAAAYFASEIIHALTSDGDKINKVLGILKMKKGIAQSQDAMEESVKFLPKGSWSNSRLGIRNGGRRDGGSRGRLIG